MFSCFKVISSQLMLGHHLKALINVLYFSSAWVGASDGHTSCTSLDMLGERLFFVLGFSLKAHEKQRVLHAVTKSQYTV